MAKDVGTAIRKSIVVSFLPCLVTFLGFYPCMVLRFCKWFCVTCFFEGRNVPYRDVLSQKIVCSVVM